MINRADAVIKRAGQVARNVMLGTSSGGGVGGAGLVTTSPVPPATFTSQDPTTGADIHVALTEIDNTNDNAALTAAAKP